MARAIRRSDSSALMLHSENAFRSRILDFRIAQSPVRMMPPVPRGQLWRVQNCSVECRASDKYSTTLEATPLRFGNMLLSGSSFEVGLSTRGCVFLRVYPEPRPVVGAMFLVVQ
jgi:hypothetical protein